MNEMKFNEFYRNWRSKLPELAESYVLDENKKLNPTRYIFSLFKKKIELFLTDKLEEVDKIIVLPGIRGAGKTTLLMQLFMIEKFLRNNDINLLSNINRLSERLYVDVSKLKMEGISLNEFFKFYEKIKGFNIISLKEKFLLLLDEVHYDYNWGLFLKSIFDSTKGHKNILVIATGSSSIHLKMNPDLSRRVRVEEIYPMKFNEYLILKHNIFPITGLSDDLQNIIFNSQNAKEVYLGLKEKSHSISSFFINTPPYAEDDFWEIGGFPYSVRVINKIRALELVKNVINSIIVKDIISFEQFKTQTVAKVNQLLYLISNSDLISYDNLKSTLKIESFETLEALINVLIMAGVLVKVNSLGKPYSSTRKTPKLLFTTPTLRTAILDNIYPSGLEGKKLEDYFALVFLKDLKNKFRASLAFDIAEKGADFILNFRDGKPIIIEVGFNKATTEQIRNTAKKVKAKYGILIGSKRLELEDNFIVKIPLDFWLLV